MTVNRFQSEQNEFHNGFTRRDMVALGFLILFCLVVFTYNNDFKIGFHIDERIKIDEAASGVFYYAHPLFLPMAMRLIKLLLGISGEQSLAIMGRSLSACMATLGISSIFLLLRRHFEARLAFLSALVVAATPMIAIHAHYIKEDASLFGFCALAFLMFDGVSRKSDYRSVVVTGIVVGLAIASKLVACLLIPAFLVMALWQAGNRRRLLIAFSQWVPLAVLVFLAINSPAFFHLTALRADQKIELQEVVFGKPSSVYVPFYFYLCNVLLPELGLFIFVTAMVGMVGRLATVRHARPIDVLMLFFGVVFYVMIAGSHYNNWPDYTRYAMPLFIVVPYFLCCAFEDITILCRRHVSVYLLPVIRFLPYLLLIPVCFMLTDTIRLVDGLKDDTRYRLARMMQDKTLKSLSENSSTGIGRETASILCYPLLNSMKAAQYAVSSSFFYDRLDYGATHETKRNEKAIEMRDAYQQLLAYPYCEMKPIYRSYAFSNPTLRVFSLKAINENQKADPTTNGQPCTEATLAALPAEADYNVEQRVFMLPKDELRDLCFLHHPYFDK
jgi:hypothetical protein